MNDNEESQGLYQALSVFCNRYDPAEDNTATDYFSSKEIKNIVESHTGVHVDMKELYELLDKMHYKYKLVDNDFMWMVRKV
jgi:uncharacterized membrane protein YkoI